MSTNEMGPADFGALMGNNGFGGDGGAWWIIILFLFVFLGCGNNGFGNNNAGAMDNYVLASDFATLQRQIDSATSSLERKGDTINAGLCDGFYAMNSALLNGFAGTNSAISTNGYETRNAITAAQINEMQNANAIQTQLANCCCENKSAIADVNYNMAMNSNATQSAIASGFCQTNFNNQNNTRDLLEAQNNNTQAILEAINRMSTEAKDAKIAEQAQTINNLQLAASQAAQNNYLISQLRATPVPAYTVPNPYSGCGCNC